MTSKERVINAIRRKPVDRIPRYFWIGEGAAKNINNEYNIPISEVDAFVGNDIMQPWLSINKQMARPCEPGEQFVDEWGITWQREGLYNAAVKHPLQDLDVAEIASYPFPDPDDESRYDELREMLAKYGDEFFIGADVSGTLFEPAYHMRTMENLMIDMAVESEEADILLDRLCDFSKRVALKAVDMGVDWVWLGDDMGTQISMLMQPDMWRKYFKPRMKEIIDALRDRRADIIVAYHSCGSIYPIIGDLAEIGIDVLNPLQESANEMEHEKIKQQYGDQLTFFCGLDTQTYLLSADPVDAAQKMKQKVELLAKGGGYIAGVSHTLQQDVPAATVMAMAKALDGPCEN